MVALALTKETQFQGHGSLTKGQRHLANKTLQELINDIITNANIEVLTTDATGGGDATEADLPVTGLLATDEILAITPIGGGTSTVALTGFTGVVDGAIDLIFTADPGAGKTLKVHVRHAVV